MIGGSYAFKAAGNYIRLEPGRKARKLKDLRPDPLIKAIHVTSAALTGHKKARTAVKRTGPGLLGGTGYWSS